MRTLRVRRLGAPVEGPGVIGFWHGAQLALLRTRPAGPLIAPISLSADGRLQALVMGRLGISDAPGSSSRGGLGAFRRMARALREGATALIALDGPRGPRGVAKPGAVALARSLSLPVWPVGAAAWPAVRLRRAWDRFLIPLPFARVVVVFGPPLLPEADVDAETQTAALEAAVHEATARATRLLAERGVARDGEGEVDVG